MELHSDGAQLFARLFQLEQLTKLASFVSKAGSARPGTRLAPGGDLAAHVTPATALASTILGPATRPVRATWFDKSPERNWSLGWHQDRTIAVRHRLDVPGFTNWTCKSGIHHVMPPVAFLERMLTLRIHLDTAADDNAPLLVSPGSHRLGRIPEARIPAVIAGHGQQVCVAQAGDVWLYATLILHASARAAAPARRRVLQLLYSADELPDGLQWLGI
jgi:hypothetical protein